MSQKLGVTVVDYMNVVRFRVKPEFKDVIVSKFPEFVRPSGWVG